MKTAVDLAREELEKAQEKANGEAAAKAEREAAAARKAMEAAMSFDPSAPPSKPIQTLMLEPVRFAQLEPIRNQHGLTVKDREQYARLLAQPWMFRRVAGHNRVHTRDEIVVVDDAMSFYAVLFVTLADAVSGDVQVREILFKELPPTQVEGAEQTGFSAEWRGLHERWAIVRDADGHTMAKGIASKDEAAYRIRTEHVPRPSAY